MIETIYEIYGIINLINNKIYIGQTKQGYIRRFKQHLTPKDGSPALRNAINKYGKENFRCELLDIAITQEEANKKEQMWIKCIGSYKKKDGYNLSMGGVIGFFNLETLEKMSESKKGEKNSFYNKKHSEISKEKMAIWKKEHYKLGEHPRAKKVMCVETGEVFSCAKEASVKTGISRPRITDVANKKQGRKTAGGYKWKWV